MKADNLTRRGFLAGLCAGLTACLSPRPAQAATPISARPPRQHAGSVSYRYDRAGRRCTTYNYDGSGRLTRVTDHPPSTSFTYESEYTYKHIAQG